MPKRTAIYPGSFDPLTNGHLAIIQRGLKVFDRLVVAVANNPQKTPLFTVDERKAMIADAMGNDPRVEVDSFDALLVEYVRAKGVHTVLRGLRAVSDFEFEFQIANMNRHLLPDLETVFVMTGEDYFFVTPEEFRRMLDRNEFLEWAVVFGTHFYGTSRRFLDEARAAGKDLLLDIDVQGAAQVKQKLPEAVSIFILPPSREELEHRLRFRRLDAPHVIARRLQQAATEIQGYSNYDYVLINDDVDRASECLNAIVLAARWQRNGSTKGEHEVKRWLELAASSRKEVVQGQVEPILRTFAEFERSTN